MISFLLTLQPLLGKRDRCLVLKAIGQGSEPGHVRPGDRNSRFASAPRNDALGRSHEYVDMSHPSEHSMESIPADIASAVPERFD